MEVGDVDDLRDNFGINAYRNRNTGSYCIRASMSRVTQPDRYVMSESNYLRFIEGITITILFHILRETLE